MIKLRAYMNEAMLTDLDPSSLASRTSTMGMFEDLWEQLGSRNFKADLSAAFARDEMGLEYTDFKAVVTGRVVIAGERWALTPTGFMLSYDSLVETLTAVYDHAGL